MGRGAGYPPVGVILKRQQKIMLLRGGKEVLASASCLHDRRRWTGHWLSGPASHAHLSSLSFTLLLVWMNAGLYDCIMS